MASTAIAVVATGEAALAGELDAIDGCIDKLRAVGGPDAKNGGQVSSSEFSDTVTEVIVGVGESRARWRCIGYSDGTTTGIQSLADEEKF
jgi:hypothetical protein